MAGTFAPTPFLRGLAWDIDGVGLVMASALFTLAFYRKGQGLVASGFLVFVVGEGLIRSGAAMDLAVGIPSFGAGTSLWTLALVLISIPRVFPAPVRSCRLDRSRAWSHTHSTADSPPRGSRGSTTRSSVTWTAAVCPGSSR